MPPGPLARASRRRAARRGGRSRRPAPACSCAAVSRPRVAPGSRLAGRPPSSIPTPCLPSGMAGRTADDPADRDAAAATARAVWLLMSDLVLDNQRRRAVSDPLGISFGRARTVRRFARRPMSMRQLADALGIDPPNATVVVDDLESLGLVRRRPHPSDGRAKLVEATRKGKALARRADAILAAPPPELSTLDADDLEPLRRLLERATAGS